MIGFGAIFEDKEPFVLSSRFIKDARIAWFVAGSGENHVIKNNLGPRGVMSDEQLNVYLKAIQEQSDD